MPSIDATNPMSDWSKYRKMLKSVDNRTCELRWECS